MGDPFSVAVYVEHISRLALRTGLGEFDEGLPVAFAPRGPMVVEQEAGEAEEETDCAERGDHAGDTAPGLDHGDDLPVV